MKNKHVGFLIIGIAIIFFVIVMSFNNALQTIVNTSCTHGDTCPMQTTLKTQQIVSYSLIGLLVLVGIFVAFFIGDEKTTTHIITQNTLTEEEKKKKIENLDDEEKQIIQFILNKEGSVFQSDIIKETGFTKVKITRILDRLQGKGLIDRKRRGMTNIIIIK
ncbi:MAG: MarR family transcriptional regulator [Candidatus Woesearchaeota archaeon]